MRYRVIPALLFAALLSLGSGSAVAQSPPGIGSTAADPYAGFVAEASRRFGIPEHWIRAVLHAESAGDVRAISPAGALGLMQVMPDTWAMLRIRHGFGRDPYDPRDNIHAGTAYLREMWDRYGNVAAMLAAYNAGPARYDEYLASGRALPAETRAYIAALAPLIGGEVPAEILTPRPSDWREAPLFATRSADTRATATLSPDAQSGDIHPAAPVGNDANAEPRDSGIFVARANDGGAQ
ncbi:Membrane-bound lytic murein transglycosylase C [Sphingomonas sp. S2M10]|uniref:lytic transglycosylase domain-containing protein n=1 Tax=Sphingomonas sp. S2M10 TaxID=2705010 RepID=UPI0014570BE0|nr:lytic transglycosylase domain-containing protein [Sphingomonas sp. S2M10]NLS28312.1 Membrane-bound lytic murein transglycosylase C [Sphingomonas sp. S2M10]